jgi:hypothetical protein
MKLYGIKPVEREFEWGKMKVVELGEEGRGRKQMFIPFHAEEGLDSYDIGQTKTGRIKIMTDRNTPPKKGWIAKLSGDGVYTRGTYGSVYILLEDKSNIEILEKGYGAFGIAGRIGSWNDFLVIVKDYPTRFLIRPAGGSHKIERYWLVFTDSKVYKVYNKALEAFIETTDIYLPQIGDISNMESSGEIIDLDKLFNK